VVSGLAKARERRFFGLQRVPVIDRSGLERVSEAKVGVFLKLFG